MKKSIIFLVFFVKVFLFHSQSSFELFHSNQYQFYNSYRPVIGDDNSYYCPFTQYSSDYSTIWTGIYKLTSVGEIVDSLVMSPQENYFFGQISPVIIKEDNYLFSFGPINNYLTDETIYKGYKIDFDLNIVDSVTVQIDEQFRVSSASTIEFIDNMFVVLSYAKDNYLNSSLPYNGIFMMDVAYDFSSFHYTISMDDDDVGFAHDFAPMSNGNYLLACFPTWQYNYTGQWNPQSTTLGVFSDSLTPIYTVEMDAFHFWNEIDIDNFQDSLFIISGNKMTHFNPDDTYFGKDLGVYIMDENLNVLDSVEIYTAPYADTTDHTCSQCLDQFDENTIYFGSTKNFQISLPAFSNEPNWIRLVKMDANLDIIWEKFYGGDKVNYVTGIKATPDGGCLILCNYYDYEIYPDIYKSDLRYIKVDGNGEVTSVQENLDFQVKSLLMFPNPSDGEVNIDTALRDYQIWFYNHQGQLVYQTLKLSHSQHLDLHHLAQGIYTYVVMDALGNRLDGGQWVKR